MSTLTIVVWALAALQVPIALVTSHVLARGRAATATAEQWRRAARCANRLANATLVAFVLMTATFIWTFEHGGAAYGIDLGWRVFAPVWLALLFWQNVLHWHGNRLEVAEAEKQGRMPVLEA